MVISYSHFASSPATEVDKIRKNRYKIKGMKNHHLERKITDRTIFNTLRIYEVLKGMNYSSRLFLKVN